MEARAHTGDTGLARGVVGLPTAISTTFSLIVGATVLATVVGGFFASWVWLLALAIALFVMYMQSLSLSELATMIPKAGSMNEYVRAGLGPFFATITVLVGYIAIQVFPGSAETFSMSIVTSDVLGAPGDFKLWSVIFIGFLVILNLLGVRPFAALEIFLTFAVAGIALVVGIVGLAGAGSGDPIGGAFPEIDLTWSLLSSLLGLAIFTFVGVEYTCPLAEELKRPARDIPWGILIGLTLIAVPVVLLGLAGARYLDGEKLSSLAPTLHIDLGIAIWGDTGKWLLGLTSLMASLGTLNAVLAGVPRILYGMSQTNQLPRFFGYLLPSTRAPAVGIVAMAIPPVVLNLTGFTNRSGTTFLELILAGVLGWAAAYFLIHLSLVSLRLREPAASRPFRSPWFPLPQILGSGLLALAAFKIFPDPSVREDIYIDFVIFLAIAVAFSLVYNLWTHKSLKAIFTPVPLAEVYAETEQIAAELPYEIEAHPHLPGHHEEKE